MPKNQGVTSENGLAAKAVVTPKTAVAAKLLRIVFHNTTPLLNTKKQLLYNLAKQYAYPHVSMFPYK